MESTVVITRVMIKILMNVMTDIMFDGKLDMRDAHVANALRDIADVIDPGMKVNKLEVE